jgi:hypothetical protein
LVEKRGRSMSVEASTCFPVLLGVAGVNYSKAILVALEEFCEIEGEFHFVTNIFPKFNNLNKFKILLLLD